MPVIFRCILYFAFILLAGCSSPKPNHEAAACKMVCQQRMNVCNQVCDNDCRQCGTCSNRAALEHYNRYRHQQLVGGAEIARELQSYRDPLQCRKITCECMADYKICVQACSGVIKKRLQVAPTCC